MTMRVGPFTRRDLLRMACPLSFPLAGPHRIRELWTGEDLGRHADGAVALDLPARSGRVLLCAPA
jgi:hypothetical protein